ncbi:MAG: RNA 2',3'-cyclic phosphodiesterase [Methylomicrobium sp.]
MKRLFFALWPDDCVRKQCAHLIKSLPVGNGRPIKPDNIHVTLVFLGSVDSDLEAKIVSAADALRSSPVSVVFDRLSYWRKPAIVCLTSSQPDTRLIELAEQLTSMVSSFGHAVDERPFAAHVTLLKKIGHAPAMQAFEPIVWSADRFCLVESCALPEGGVDYRIVQSWSLIDAERNGKA